MATNVRAGAIEAEDVTLEYPLYKNIVLDRLRAILAPVVPVLSPPMKRAVDEVSFSIDPGELVGIVGVNGAGKTSLLKIVSGLVTPTRGTVSVGGRILALLAMGVGFRPNLTGRENLFYAGLLFRLRSHEIRAILPSVEEFSELGSALDQPYFTYSSGMRARLAFSLATHVPADVIILDETLATGDARFAAKCYGRIKELHGSGRTILFVSHNLGEVSRLCDRVIILHKGGLLFDGDASKGLRQFEHVITADTLAKGARQIVQAGVVVEVTARGPDDAAVGQLPIGRPATIRAVVRSNEALGDQFVFLKIIRDEDDRLVSYLFPDRWRTALREGAELRNVPIVRGETVFTWEIDNWVLGEGTYRIDAFIGPASDWRSIDPHQGLFWHNTCRLRSIYTNLHFQNNGGTIEIPSSFTVEATSADAN